MFIWHDKNHYCNHLDINIISLCEYKSSVILKKNSGDKYFCILSNCHAKLTFIDPFPSVYVKMLVHCTAQLEMRVVFDIGFSSCTAPNYLLVLVSSLQMCSGDSKDFWNVWKLSKSSEVIWNWHSPEWGECRG